MHAPSSNAPDLIRGLDPLRNAVRGPGSEAGALGLYQFVSSLRKLS
jgi:hypothetical protein